MVQPDAVALSARRLPREEPLGMGGHSQHPVRPAPGTLRLPRVHEPARVRRHSRLRRYRLQRAPPERLRPHALAESDRGGTGPAHLALRHLRDRQLHRLLQSAHPRGRGVRHARRDLGRPAGRGLSRRHAHGHQLLLRADPRSHARQVSRGARAHHEGVGGGRALLLRRQVQPAPLGQLLAQAHPEAASAHLHPRGRLHRDVGLLPRLRLQLLLPLLLRLPPRQIAPRWLLGAGGQARQGRVAVSRGLRPDHLRGGDRSRGGGALRRALSLLLQPVPPRVSAVRRSAGLPHGEHHQVRRPQPAHRGAEQDPGEPHVEAARGRALRHRGQPGNGAPAARGVHQGAPRRPHLLPLPQRQHAGLEDALLEQALRGEGDAAPPRPLAGVEARSALVDHPHGRALASGGDDAGGGKGSRGAAVLESGSGHPLVFFHSAGGLLAENPFLDELAGRYHVFAPELPGYGESTGEDLLEDMLDFALHGWDVVDTLGLRRPHLVGHSMGGMITAEMAAIAPHDAGKLVLVGAAGLWMDEHPIPDLFSLLPEQFAELLFHDPLAGQALLTGGVDFSDMEALKNFYIGQQRRLAMAGKILFPIPNRRVSKRLYRLTAETLVLWGRSDKLIVPAYGELWARLIPRATLILIADAGHMLPYEQPKAFVDAVSAFLG